MNAGSSTLKYQVLDPATGRAVLRAMVDRIGDEVPDHDAALALMRERVREAGIGQTDLLAIGHRVVHGGQRLTRPTLVDDEVLTEIEELAELAPLHNPSAAAGIRSARNRFPELPQVAVFDTGFFADLPPASATYAVDARLAQLHGLRRYGAHGISHEFVSTRAAAFLDREPRSLRQIVLHLGSGASASAISGGRPLDTSMGLTPLEGLVMGTRSGDVDPGLLLYLMRHGGLGVEELDDLLQHRSGLQGLCGVADFRALLAALDAGQERARAGYDVYVHRLRKYLGAYLAILGGADVVAFTGGVGEHVPRLRADVVAGLEPLGIALDPVANLTDSSEPRSISSPDSAVRVLVVPTDEEWAIAHQVMKLLDGAGPGER